MTSEDLILNIAVNLDRISRFAIDGKEKRVELFIKENDDYIEEVERKKINLKFRKTFDVFKDQLSELKRNKNFKEDAEIFLTWANILQHRAKLA
jgi:hypothetical protein